MDLKSILAQNIKDARESLRITQIKLAEHAEISLPYLADIERRKTWVSDKTLQSLARALNVEAWELLRPEPAEGAPLPQDGGEYASRMAELVGYKKTLIRRALDNAMEDLVMELLREAGTRSG